MQHIHTAALEHYRAATVERTDGLVTTLHDLLLAHQEDGPVDQRFAAMDALIAPRRDEVLEACEAHLAHAGSNYFPFVWRAYKSHRATLFGLLEALPLRSTSQDATLEAALRFAQANAAAGFVVARERQEQVAEGPEVRTPADRLLRLDTGVPPRAQAARVGWAAG